MSTSARRRPLAAMTVAMWMCVLTLLVTGGGCLRDVTLRVQPPTVERGKNARLICDYDLEPSDSIYVVKFYRGQREFYRYTPKEQGVLQSNVFPITGINVDLSHSNATQVALTNVGFSLTGNVSCEVTIDKPSFKMAQAGAPVTVIALPRSPPKVWTNQDRYESGEQLIANCTAPPSTPPATLSFQINNHTVPSGDTVYRMNADREQWSALSIHMPLDGRHFQAGRLTLQCTARLTAGYASKSAPLELGVRPSEPVPERVTSSSGWRTGGTQLLAIVLVPCLRSLWSPRSPLR